MTERKVPHEKRIRVGKPLLVTVYDKVPDIPTFSYAKCGTDTAYCIILCLVAPENGRGMQDEDS